MRRETVGDTDSIAMIGWDDTKREYRIVRAISNGGTNEAVPPRIPYILPYIVFQCARFADLSPSPRRSLYTFVA